MQIDALMMVAAGMSCLLMAFALWFDKDQHKDLPRRQWTGYELIISTWGMIGLFAVAKGVDEYALPNGLLDFAMACALMGASIGIGLWGIKGRKEHGPEGIRRAG